MSRNCMDNALMPEKSVNHHPLVDPIDMGVFGCKKMNFWGENCCPAAGVSGTDASFLPRHQMQPSCIPSIHLLFSLFISGFAFLGFYLFSSSTLINHIV